MLLQARADPDARTNVRARRSEWGWVLTVWLVAEQNGSTALHWAASHNSLEVAEMLLIAGAEVDASDKVSTCCT